MTKVILGSWKCTPVHPGAIVINVAGRTISRDDRVVVLPRRPFRFAMILLATSGRLLSKADLFESAFGEREDGGPFEKGVDTTLCTHVRPALRALGVEVETVWGQGYRVSAHPLPTSTLAAPATTSKLRRAA